VSRVRSARPGRVLQVIVTLIVVAAVLLAIKFAAENQTRAVTFTNKGAEVVTLIHRQEGLGRATMETHPVQPGSSVSIDLRKKDRVGVLSAASALGFKPLVFAADAKAVSVSVSADGTVSVTP
jgi:hypothetical protein